jgi:isopentenyl-diphosphate delta-isomerase
MTGTDQVMTQGPEGRPMDVVEAHRAPGTLHLAVSVQLVDADGNWLVQQRAYTKPVFAGRWANSCCTHPRPGEPVGAAGRRRVGEELGIEAPRLVEAGSFTYRAADPASEFIEHEYDTVLVGRYRGPRPDCAPVPDEIATTAWLPFDQALALVCGAQGAPWAFTVLELARAALPALGAASEGAA